MNDDAENDLIEEMNRPYDPCRECPYSEETGMCESHGAIWQKGEWKPTKECIPKKR